MSGHLLLLPWIALMVVGIGAMQWGAARAADALDAYAGRAGMRGTVTGALLGIATATPEISVNVASVAFGWPDLGLGTALGSNVPALPLVFLLSWWSLRRASVPGRTASRPESERTRPNAPVRPVVAPEAMAVQALPYLLVVLLLAVLSLPARWAGLQPIDGFLLLGAWGLYLTRALRQRREEPARRRAAGPAFRSGALLAVPIIALGSLASVVAARRLADAFGASDLVVGLFVVGLLCALPESFAAWHLAREGKTTVAVSTAMADGIVSLTVALVPPALAGAAVGDGVLYRVNLAFLAFVLVAYMPLHHARQGREITGRHVFLFLGAYALYLASVIWLLSR